MPTFTPKQASETLEIPPSTLRRYRLEWAAYLSVPDKSRRLTQADLDTLGIIRDHIGKKSRGEIEAILQGTPLIDEQPGGAIQSVDFFSQVMEQLTEEHKTALQAKDDHISDLRREIDQLRADLKPWWKRLRD